MLKIAENNGETTKQDAIDNTILTTSRSHDSPSIILARNNNLNA